MVYQNHLVEINCLKGHGHYGYHIAAFIIFSISRNFAEFSKMAIKSWFEPPGAISAWISVFSQNGAVGMLPAALWLLHMRQNAEIFEISEISRKSRLSLYMTFFAEIRLGAAHKAQNEPFSLILELKNVQSQNSHIWWIFHEMWLSLKKFHFSLGFAVFVRFCSEKSMMELNVSLFGSAKLHDVMCTHQAHQVYQAHTRHIFLEIQWQAQIIEWIVICKTENAIWPINHPKCRKSCPLRSLLLAKSVPSKLMCDNTTIVSFFHDFPYFWHFFFRFASCLF